MDIWETLCRDFQSQRATLPQTQHLEAAEQFIQSARQLLRPGSPRLGDACEIAADLCHAANDGPKATRYYQEALEIATRQNLPEPAARVAGKLAILQEEAGRAEAAVDLFKQSLKWFEVAQDFRQHPALLSHCAALHRRLGNRGEARRQYEEAIRFASQLHGENHPDVAMLLNNFGVALCEWKHFSEAETCYLRALQICESAFGSTHPDVGQAMGNLAVLYHAQRDFSRAEKFYQAALQILARSREPNDPELLALRANSEALRKSTLRIR